MLYITDFTERNDLATPPTALWSCELPGRIVTLELQGPQSKMADKMETGAFFTVKHMRLIERIAGGRRVVGRIGGPDRLIHKLNANSPNQELENLLEYVRSIISVRVIYCILMCCFADERSGGKKKLQRQDRLKALLPLPTS